MNPDYLNLVDSDDFTPLHCFIIADWCEDHGLSSLSWREEGNNRQNYLDGKEVTCHCNNCDKLTICTFKPDPFDWEINGDARPVWICEECEYQSAQDI